MKSLVALACVLAFTAADPPENSYLPPSPGARNGLGGVGGALGSVGALPQVAVARSNGIGSNGALGRQGYDGNAQAFGRNGLEGGIGGTVNYEADARGFNPRVSYQGGQGYDSNAQLIGGGFGARTGGY